LRGAAGTIPDYQVPGRGAGGAKQEPDSQVFRAVLLNPRLQADIFAALPLFPELGAAQQRTALGCRRPRVEIGGKDRKDRKSKA
jgi:hypothetical protein